MFTASLCVVNPLVCGGGWLVGQLSLFQAYPYHMVKWAPYLVVVLGGLFGLGPRCGCVLKF